MQVVAAIAAGILVAFSFGVARGLLARSWRRRSAMTLDAPPRDGHGPDE